MALLGAVFGLFLALLFSGMWLGISTALLGMMLIYANTSWGGMLQATGWIVWASADLFTLIAIPLFIFMGLILTESKIGQRIYTSLAPLLNHFPGGLLYSNIVAGALFAATTGSATAATATIGSIALPEMEKRDYPFGISIGTVAAGAILAPIIPPSIIMIFYATVTQQSIGAEFIAGIIPGLILTGMFIVYVALTFRLRFRRRWHKIRGELIPWKTAIMMTRDIWLVVVLIGMVLGSIFAGIATPSEAAAVGVLGAVLLALLDRKLTWDMVKRATIGAVIITCQLQFIYFGVQIFSAALARAGLVYQATQLLVNLPVPAVVILIIIYLVFLILGMLIESIPMLLMIVPVVFPAIITLGYDPIWFGIAVTILCVTGNVTPPVGVALFVLQALNPHRKVTDIWKGPLPFVFITLALLAIITAFPQLCLFLPSLMLE